MIEAHKVRNATRIVLKRNSKEARGDGAQWENTHIEKTVNCTKSKRCHIKRVNMFPCIRAMSDNCCISK